MSYCGAARPSAGATVAPVQLRDHPLWRRREPGEHVGAATLHAGPGRISPNRGPPAPGVLAPYSRTGPSPNSPELRPSTAPRPVSPLPAIAPVLRPSTARRGEALSLRVLAGDWSDDTDDGFVWTIGHNGRALGNGEHFGPLFDLAEYGSGEGMVIVRGDGWAVDMRSSTAGRVVWTKASETSLVWIRRGGAVTGSPISGRPALLGAAAGQLCLSSSPLSRQSSPASPHGIFSRQTSRGSQAEYFRPEQTILLLDWDDTLCPSAWIQANRPALNFFQPCPQEERFIRPLREVQEHTESLLRLALQLGKVVIVTNALEPWVETSCRNFLPALVPLVSTIPVLYARSVYETQGLDCVRHRGGGIGMPGMYTSDGLNKALGSVNERLEIQSQDALPPQLWKELTFEQEITGFYSRYAHQSWKNIISIGDSIFERDAVHRVVLSRPDMKTRCRTKTAKLIEEPGIQELIIELRVVNKFLAPMVHYDGHLDIEIEEDDLEREHELFEKISAAMAGGGG